MISLNSKLLNKKFVKEQDKMLTKFFNNKTPIITKGEWRISSDSRIQYSYYYENKIIFSVWIDELFNVKSKWE